MRKVSLTGNSLAHLLCQEQKRVAHGQDHTRKVSLTGNSLAHLLCQEQKRHVAYGQDHGPGIGVIMFIRTGTVGAGRGGRRAEAAQRHEPELV